MLNKNVFARKNLNAGLRVPSDILGDGFFLKIRILDKDGVSIFEAVQNANAEIKISKDSISSIKGKNNRYVLMAESSTQIKSLSVGNFLVGFENEKPPSGYLDLNQNALMNFVNSSGIVFDGGGTTPPVNPPDENSGYYILWHPQLNDASNYLLPADAPISPANIPPTPTIPQRLLVITTAGKKLNSFIFGGFEQIGAFNEIGENADGLTVYQSAMDFDTDLQSFDFMIGLQNG